MSRLFSGGAALRPFHDGTPLLGVALTVRTRPGDNLMVHKAIDMAEPGDVIVVDAGGDVTNSIIGEIMTTLAAKKGIAGFVIDGAVRDTDAMRISSLPVYARGPPIADRTRTVPARSTWSPASAVRRSIRATSSSATPTACSLFRAPACRRTRPAVPRADRTREEDPGVDRRRHRRPPLGRRDPEGEGARAVSAPVAAPALARFCAALFESAGCAVARRAHRRRRPRLRRPARRSIPTACCACPSISNGSPRR